MIDWENGGSSIPVGDGDVFLLWQLISFEFQERLTAREERQVPTMRVAQDLSLKESYDWIPEGDPLERE